MNASATARIPWPVLREDFAARRALREDEVADVAALLLDHADPQAGPAEWREAAATAVAVACLGDNHLWQDLLLANRGELNAIMRHWFPAIVAKNSGDMKWKKFFYRQLCERAEILICKSPSCGVCTDQPVCFEAPEAQAHGPITVIPAQTGIHHPAPPGFPPSRE
ncbi:MAG: nitrogen fixation protein NifQ [Vitreoscilla sp.]|nr:nitrogen fixation protein NifQ [Vitreoscilla sp.]